MIKRSPLARVTVSVLIALIMAIIAIFIYRYQIAQFSAEKFIRKELPEYVSIDKITFDVRGGKVTLKGIKIQNAPEFQDKYAVEIDQAICRYRLKGKMFLGGIEILEPLLVKPVLNIERLADGRVNLVEMGKFIGSENAKSPKPGSGDTRNRGSAAPSPATAIGRKKMSDIVKIPESFQVKDGMIMFTDRQVVPGHAYKLAFDKVNSKLNLKLGDDYANVLDVGSTGQAELNGDRTQEVKWNISLKPMSPRLTMSNRFDVTGVDIVLVKPYYDKYSPFDFRKGRMSGTLVFDFDNGSIGSTNEIHLKDIAFVVKPGYENAEFWQTTVQDLAKYFTQFGEIVFDFKIKGEISNPKFYLGPISKDALTGMVIDKVSAIVQEATSAKGSKTETEKVKQYIDVIQNLMKKK